MNVAYGNPCQLSETCMHVYELTETNFKTSSRTSTGALRYNTAFHSIQFKGVIANSDCESTSVTGLLNKGEITHSEERDI
jgi:hypothetical protein